MSFTCDDCGRRIFADESHVCLRDGRIVCMAHYVAHLDARMVYTVLTGAALAKQAGRPMVPPGRTDDRRPGQAGGAP